MLRHPGDDEREAPPGDEDAEGGAGERDAERFGEELADHARAVGADGGADGEFVLALCAAGEEKDGDVAAADEEQARRRRRGECRAWCRAGGRIAR